MSNCEKIKNNKLQSNLSIDKNICCDDAGCSNLDTCYYPSILVMCRAIVNAGACNRRNQPDVIEFNNTLAKEFCDEKNTNKHICVSTNSTIHGPDLNGELNWIVNRTNSVGDSCKSCACCERNQCTRPPTNCAYACNSTIVLNNCHTTTGLSCDDLFGSGSCRLYDISTAKEITDDGRLKGPLFYKSEVCDFTVTSNNTNFTVPSNSTNPNGNGTDSGLNTSDKIAIVFGVLSFIVGVIGIMKWKIIKRYFRNFRNSRRQQ